MIADIKLEKIPSFVGVVPELIDEKEQIIKFHLHRIDGVVKSVPPITLKWKDGPTILSPPIPADALSTSFTYKLPSTANRVSVKKHPHVRIEQNFYQSLKDRSKISNKIKSRLEFNRLSNPNFNYKLYDNTDIENLLTDDIAKNDESSALAVRTKAAINALAAGAFKADIFRYYILYTRGGVWLDDKSILRCPLDDPFFGLDVYDGFMVFGSSVQGIEIAFLALTSKSVVMLNCLNTALDNVEKRIYPTLLGITGPEITHTIMKSLTQDQHYGRQEIINTDGRNTLLLKVHFPMILKNGELIWSQFAQDETILDHIIDKNHYSQLWARGQIYTDDNSNGAAPAVRLPFDPRYIAAKYLLCCIFILAGIICIYAYT